MSESSSPRARRLSAAFAGVIAACCLVASGCATELGDYNNQRVFQSPKQAVEALSTAAAQGRTEDLEAIFGENAREVLTSGDPVSDTKQREVFSVAMAQGWSLESKNSTTRELIVGDEKWPFPIPLVKDSRGWWFDTAAGADEVLARRIGRNELAAIGALRLYVTVQRQYADESHDGVPAGAYAQKIRSDPGTQNGLYWPVTNPDESPSPLNKFVADASAEGYGKNSADSPAPYRGYFYRILTRQGAAAPGGAKNYIVGGRMTEGFGMLAFPADYGNSGIMTFQVGPDGVVYESDLGEETSTRANEINEFNPGPGWQVSK